MEQHKSYTNGYAPPDVRVWLLADDGQSGSDASVLPSNLAHCWVILRFAQFHADIATGGSCCYCCDVPLNVVWHAL